jgi:hypothetical protein
LVGAFWIDLKPERRLQGLRINGERVVALDYGQIATRILYGMAQAPVPEGDLYQVARFGSADSTDPPLCFPRDGVKLMLNAMIYASESLSRFPKDTRKYFRKDRLVDVLERIMEHHSPIKDLFFRRIGLRAMWIESQIMVEVLLRCMDRSVVGLPVHDALIVQQSAYETARDLMLDAFRKHAGTEGKVSGEAWYEDYTQYGGAGVDEYPRASRSATQGSH